MRAGIDLGEICEKWLLLVLTDDPSCIFAVALCFNKFAVVSKAFCCVPNVASQDFDRYHRLHERSHQTHVFEIRVLIVPFEVTVKSSLLENLEMLLRRSV